MRLVSVLLFLAGIALALVGPLVWPGRLPVVLGAVCVLAGALLARRRVWLALGGIAIAVAVFLAPGLANGWRNGRGIAWEVPDGQTVELAEAGYAITVDIADLSGADRPTTVTGRDIDSGKRRWRTVLGKPQDPVGGVSVRRVGQTLLVVDRDGALHALDLRTGKQRWTTPPADRTFPEIANAQTVATLRCNDPNPCTVEARALADGAVRWRAPADDDNFLGAPLLTRDSSGGPPLWPASIVIVHVPPDRTRYEVHDLDTGRVLASGNAEQTVTASLGDLFLLSDGRTVRASDAASGRLLWRHRLEGDQVVRTVDPSARTMAVIDGGPLLSKDGGPLPDLTLEDTLRLLGVHGGQLTEHRLGFSGRASVYATPGFPLLRHYEELVVDGRRFVRERLDPTETAATTSQVGFKSTLSVYGLGKRRAIEVYNRRGGRVERFAAADAHVRSVGDRLVISVGKTGHQRSYVVSGR